MNNEKPVSAALYFKGEKVADLSSVNPCVLNAELDEIFFVDSAKLDNGYILDTSRMGDDEERPYVTRTKHPVITRGEWVTIASAPSHIGAKVAHRIWEYALGSNDKLIDAYIVNQFDAERKDK